MKNFTTICISALLLGSCGNLYPKQPTKNDTSPTMEEEIKDPSVTGVSGLKGVNTKEAEKIAKDNEYRKKYAHYRPSRNRDEWIANNNAREMEAPSQNVGFVGVGDSKYDKEITSLTDLADLSNFRGEKQPWTESLPGIILFSVFFSAFVAFIGLDRKIGFLRIFLLSLLFTPIIGAIIALYSKKKELEFIEESIDNSSQNKKQQ